MNQKLLSSIMVIVFVLVGCSAPQNNYITPQQINEPTIAEITPVFETQVERVNNCDGTNPTYNVSYKTIETQKAAFEVSVGAGGLVTGTPIPSVLEVQLEAKITAALAKDYGLTTEKNHDLTLENVQGTFLGHTITWKVTRVKGLIEVIYGDGVAQVGFEKIANVELYNRTSEPIGCDSSVNIPPTAIDSTQIPLATLQTEPPPTIALPTTVDEAARKWGGQSSWWEKLSDTGWKLRGSLTVTVEEGWRIDYMDTSGNIKSCADKYEAGVYGPATLSVVEATLWYVPGETRCPSWTIWSQNNP